VVILCDVHGGSYSASGSRGRRSDTPSSTIWFTAILGLIALAGILMRNTLILIGQIKTNQEEGLIVIALLSRRLHSDHVR
jgi:hypothetical protein